MIIIKKIISIILAFMLSLMIFGCGKSKAVQTDTKVDNKETNEPAKEEPKYYAMFTGEEVTEEDSKNVPYFVIIENLKAARPQSGLTSADIVYETMAEGGIPRFIALFQSKKTDKIGPVRSARPYFLDIAKEYNLPFGHCGGSAEAINRIQNEGLMSLNEFAYSGTYWRDKARKAPHNLYTSSEKMITTVTDKGYTSEPLVKLTFDKDYWDTQTGTPALNINMKLSSYYSTSYEYKDGKYYKYMDGKPSLDKETNNQIAVTNLIIQKTSINLQKDNIHLTIKLIGKGTGYFISNGKAIEITWERSSINSQTVIKDSQGNVVPFNIGNTWWNIISTSNTVSIK
ncbi:MAG: DUF3048 domain-containing protein [Bacillota bacterium]|nr:DUF3048 domain-containing protein [Bacillota bacterium]